jgi:hypothetical protein
MSDIDDLQPNKPKVEPIPTKPEKVEGLPPEQMDELDRQMQEVEADNKLLLSIDEEIDELDRQIERNYKNAELTAAEQGTISERVRILMQTKQARYTAIGAASGVVGSILTLILKGC